jgi:hypothetical protein
MLGAGKPIEPEKRLDVADWRARVGLTWEQITSIFPKATAPAAINGAIAAANERFFAQYVPVRDKAYQNLIAARPLGMSGKEWSDASNPGLDAIVESAMPRSRRAPRTCRKATPPRCVR